MSEESTLKGILKGIDLIIDHELLPSGVGKGRRLPRYSNKSTMLQLIERKCLNGSFKSLCERCYKQISDNFHPATFRRSSTGNWVLRRELETNHKIEVKLERMIAALDQTWSNQVATASGFVGSGPGKRSAIDLVRALPGGTYQFIELKVRSNTPVSAAVEVLGYALLYIFSRKQMEKLQIAKDLPLMSAKKIELRVLAPGGFFTDGKRNSKEDLDLEWFEKSLNYGLKQFCEEHEATIEMDFKFLKFGRGFTWPMPELGASNEEALLELLRQEVNRIEPVYGRAAA